MKRLIMLVALFLCPAARLRGQELRVDLSGTSASERETSSDRVADGPGLRGDVTLATGKLRLFAGLGRNWFSGNAQVDQPFTMEQRAAGAQWIFWRGVSARIATERWTIQPRFAAQDVGFLSVGLAADRPLGKSSRMFAHMAYLPVTRFGGGGHAHLATDFGFGAQFDLHVVALEAEYRLVRLDRTVAAGTVPIELSEAHVGIGRALCLRASHCAGH